MELLESFEEFDYPLLKKAAKRIPAERLWVNPDCGLKTRGWPETRAALANMVQAAHPDCGLKTRGWPETRAALANMVQAAQNLRRG